MNFKIAAQSTICTVVLFLFNATPAQETWNWVNPLPQGNLLNAIASNDTLLVIVGSNGTILISNDGNFWKARNSETRADLFDVIWTGMMFIAVGDSGTILTSTDGELWKKNVIIDSIGLFGIAHTRSKIVAVGSYGIIAHSTDGQHWSSICTDSLFQYCCIAASDSVFVALERNGKVARSSDGINWTFALLGDPSLKDIIWTGNSFVALGSVCHVSEDGNDWTSKNGPSSRYSISYSGSQYVVAGTYGETSISTDLLTWTTSKCSVNVNLYAISFWKERYIAAGTSGVILISIDGKNWNRSGEGTWYFMYDIIWTGARWVAVGNNILTSDDGITWVKSRDDYAYLRAITNAGNRLIAVGLDGKAYYSQDGTTWDAGNTGSSQNLFSTTTWNGNVIAGGNAGTMLVSSDERTWNIYKIDDDETFWDIAASPSLIIAAGWNAYGFSTNARNWTLSNWPYKVSIESIEWSGKEFIAVGDSGAVLLSPDGSSWQKYYAGCRESLMDVCWTGNEYIAVGENGVMVYSKNGKEWISIAHLLTDRTLFGVHSNKDMVLAVGKDGVILQSTLHSNIYRKSNQNMQERTFRSRVKKYITLDTRTRNRLPIKGHIYGSRLFDINGRKIAINNASLDARILLIK